MRKVLFLILIICCGIMVGRAQTIAFVSATAANDDDTGLSWEHAKKTIPAALDLVGTNGIVCVKAGNYSLSAQLIIPTGVEVRGGYSLSSAGTDTSHRETPGLNSRWENASICTVISGSGSHRLATVNGLLEGCVLRRGVTTDKGGGVLIDGGTVRYCVIKECDAINENTMVAEGGGVYIRNNGLLTNCVVTECRGDKGPAVSGGNGSLINNTITRNWPTHCGTVADYDGNVYNTVVIGQQCWTKQNMRSMHYNDGSVIRRGSENSVTIPYYYVNYNALTAAMLPNYGYLYNWTAAMHGAPSSSANPSGVTGICPLGWHLPSDSEYIEMKTFVNTILANRCNGSNNEIAKSLASRTGWPGSSGCNVGSNQANNNNTLFSAFPAGYYDNGFSETSWANLWTSTQTSPYQAVTYYMNYNNSYFNRDAIGNKARARSVRCVKSLSVSAPEIHTLGVNVVSATAANCGGRCSHGGNPAIAMGICWSTSPNPTIVDNHTNDGSGEGLFNSQMTGLTVGTTYYVRAYMQNSAGVFYGEERTYTHVAYGDCGDLVVYDYDGNVYHTVQIGTQCWLKENMHTTHYVNGDPIPYGNSEESYENPYYYRYTGADEDVYGLYYNWPAAVNGSISSTANPSGIQGVCPDGWHIPSNAEWQQLANYVSSQNEYLCDNDPANIGKALSSTTGWNNSGTACAVGNNRESNNATGFSAMPAGYSYSSSSYLNRYAHFWAATHDAGNSYYYAYYWYMYYGYKDLRSSYTSKSYGYSVRCVRN